jgi:hypothetical protein
MAGYASDKTDWLGRLVGLGVFLLGIGLLVSVFVMTNRTLGETPVLPSGQKPDWGLLGTRLGMTFARLLLLGFVASWIAGRGAQLYAASGHTLRGD